MARNETNVVVYRNYRMAKTNCELPNHITTHKMRYFGYVMKNRRHRDAGESLMIQDQQKTQGNVEACNNKISWLDNISMWGITFLDTTFYAQFRGEKMTEVSHFTRFHS